MATLDVVAVASLMVFLLAVFIPSGSGDSVLDFLFERLSDWLPGHPLRVEFISALVLSAMSTLVLGGVAIRNYGVREIQSTSSIGFMVFYTLVGAIILFAFVIDRGLSQFIDAIVNGVIEKIRHK